jgi:hypothetical protein
MEVSWHSEEQLIVISLWHGSVCRATFRMPVSDAPDLAQMLVGAIADALPNDAGRTQIQEVASRIVTLAERRTRSEREPLWMRDVESEQPSEDAGEQGKKQTTAPTTPSTGQT